MNYLKKRYEKNHLGTQRLSSFGPNVAFSRLAVVVSPGL